MPSMDKQGEIRNFIHRLGGPTKVALQLDGLRRTKKPVTCQRVTNWERIGIPAVWRFAVADLAIREGVTEEEIPGQIRPIVALIRNEKV